MNWDRLNQIFSIVANLAVVAGFVMVAIQLQQNTAAIRLQTLSMMNSASVEAEGTFAGDTVHLAQAKAIYHPSELTPAEMSQVWGYLNMYVNSALNTWYSLESGHSSVDDWVAAKANLKGAMDYGVGHIIWNHEKSGWPSRFVAEVDAALNSGEAMSTEQTWLGIMADIRKLNAAGDDADASN
jgi:hypothetical protein